MRKIVTQLFLIVPFFCFSQISLSTESGKSITIVEMKSIDRTVSNWLSAMEIMKPKSYEDYCSYYLADCPVTQKEFRIYEAQISSAEINPIAEVYFKMEGNDYLLFSMEIISKFGSKQRIPLLVLVNGGNFMLIPQEIEQKLFATKALISYLDPETFMQNAPEVFGNSPNISELELYNKLMDEAAKPEIESESVFNLPPINIDKKLPLIYQGKMATTYSSSEYQRAEILMQRGFEQEATQILLSKMTAEELNKMIKDEARN